MTTQPRPSRWRAPIATWCAAPPSATRDLVAHLPASLSLSQTKKKVFGFVSGGAITPEEEGFVFCSPGVNLAHGGDALGQQYNTPDVVIGAKGSDVIIVGRGIYEAKDPRAAAEEYRKAGWAAYEASLVASS